jgi:hypothetical protein
VGFLRRSTGATTKPGPARVSSGTWARPERPDQSAKAAAVGWPHRYRGSLIMLRTDLPPGKPDRVVRVKALGMADGSPAYTCWQTDGQLVELPEDVLAPPDERAVTEALAGAGPGAPQARWAHLYDVLRTGYVWVTSAASNWVDRSYEEWLFGVYGLVDGTDASRDAGSSPLPVFTDLDHAERFHEASRLEAVAARVPFVVACRLAELFGDSDGIIFNPGLEPRGALGRATYRLFPDSVVGYDYKLRPLPSGGLDAAWLGPIRHAAEGRPEVRAAFAWRTAVPPGGEVREPVVDCLGLVLDDGLDTGAFDRARAAIRERAIALGMPANHRYGVAEVQLDGPYAADAVDVVRIKAPTQ